MRQMRPDYRPQGSKSAMVAYLGNLIGSPITALVNGNSTTNPYGAAVFGAMHLLGNSSRYFNNRLVGLARLAGAAYYGLSATSNALSTISGNWGDAMYAVPDALMAYQLAKDSTHAGYFRDPSKVMVDIDRTIDSGYKIAGRGTDLMNRVADAFSKRNRRS